MSAVNPADMMAVTPLLASANDTTWIEGTIRCSEPKSFRIGHAMLFLPRAKTAKNEGVMAAMVPMASMHMSEGATPPLVVVPLDSNGFFRLATLEKGLLLLRIASPTHAPLDQHVYCSGGHTVRLEGSPASIFTTSPDIDKVVVYMKDTVHVMKPTGKGRYGASIKTRDSALIYRIDVWSRRAVEPVSVTGNPNSLVHKRASGLPAPDDNGIYWSSARTSKGVAKIQFNIAALSRTCDMPSVTFLSNDDATIDSIISQPPTQQTFMSYVARSERVREVAALKYGAPMDALLAGVPPTSIAWTIGTARFFDLLMQAGTNAATAQYIDSLLLHHPVRRIIPHMQSATVAFSYRMGALERGKLHAEHLMREFPDHEQAAIVRDIVDPNRPLQIGKPMPDFDWTDVREPASRITANDLSGKYTLFFVAPLETGVSEDRRQFAFKELERMQKMYAAKGLNIISIAASRKEMPPGFAQSVTSQPWPTIYSDGKDQSPISVMRNRAPYVMLVGPDRTILTLVGGLDVAEAERTLIQRLGN